MRSCSKFDDLRVRTGLPVCVLMLCGCVAGVAVDIVSIGTTGKSIADHVLDVITGEDCNLFQTAIGSGRKVCEPHEAAAKRGRNLSEGAIADPPAAEASDGASGLLGPNPGPSPGGPPGS